MTVAPLPDAVEDALDSDFLKLLAHLHRGGQYAYWWLISEAKDGHNQALEKQTIWWSVRKPAKLPSDTGQHGPRHLYFSVHSTTVKRKSWQRAKLEHIAAINCLFAEFDAKDFSGELEGAMHHITTLSPPPSVVINSGGGYHCYWLLHEPSIIRSDEDREQVKRIQYAWVNFVGSDAGAKDLCRVLRIPGTKNYKATYAPNFPTVQIVKLDFDCLYNLAELAAIISPPTPTSGPAPAHHGSGKSYSLADDRLTAERNLERLAPWRCDDYSPDGTWIGVGMALHDGLGEAGLPLWISWSQKSQKYTEGECERKWRTFTAGGGLTLASLAFWANQDDPPIQIETNSNGHLSSLQPAIHLSPENGFDEAANVPPLPESARLPESSSAGASPWLDNYIAFSRRWSPRAFEGFHEACALWILSTISARRVLANLGGPRYGNLYIALTARTSLYAKSSTAKIALETLQKAGLDWMLAPDDSSPQAFINALANNDLPPNFDNLSPDRQDRVKNRLALRGARGWYYEEFGQKLTGMMKDGGFMADFRGHLRRFDDCPLTYEYLTIGRGSDTVQRPYLALLANMTPADLKPLAKRGSALWNDGFLARFAFVTPPQKSSNRDRFPSGERVIPANIITPLRQWHERLGLATVNDDTISDEENSKGGKKVVIIDCPPAVCALAAEVENAFYAYHDALLDLIDQNPNADLDGNYARFAEKALRISILLASLENDNHIGLKHWARAQAITERWRVSLHILYNQVTDPAPSEAEQMEEKALHFVAQLGNPTAREVAQRINGLDTAGAAAILDKLVESGTLEVEKTARSQRYSLSSGG